MLIFHVPNQSTNQPTNNMEESPYYEAIRRSASHEILHIFKEFKWSLLHSQAPTTCPYPKLDQSSPCLSIPLTEDPF